eukprot:2202194-Pyramimonas_sp.AAC.2
MATRVDLATVCMITTGLTHTVYVQHCLSACSTVIISPECYGEAIFGVWCMVYGGFTAVRCVVALDWLSPVNWMSTDTVVRQVGQRTGAFKTPTKGSLGILFRFS